MRLPLHKSSYSLTMLIFIKIVCELIGIQNLLQVSGKSAQDCFDKIHSDHLTPAPHRHRSRANISKSSSQGFVPLSASKILGPAEPKIKKSRCSKQKTHVTQKAVRDLLQKHYEVDQGYEVDMFSVLEPTASPFSQTLLQSVTPSTPEHLQGKSIFLQKPCERSSSNHKKPRSRFSSSFGSALVSPPVLKPVKNRALHEKYIDQLHSREARRKMASVQAAKSTLGEEVRKERHDLKKNVITAARNALVCDAKDAINQFQYLQANPLSNSCEFDDDINVDEDDEGEDRT